MIETEQIHNTSTDTLLEKKQTISTTGISVILPCYNEEAHILLNGVKRVVEILDLVKVPYEIILIDDCSQNNTRDLIEQVIQRNPDKPIRKMFNPVNFGRGGTVMKGIKSSQYSTVGYIDIDLEIGCEYIPYFHSEIQKGKDLVVAHRIYKVQWTPATILRFILSKGYIWFSTRLLGISYPDTESGYKFFNREKALQLIKEIQDTHWFWDTEVVIRGHYKKWNICFLPCLFVRRKDKKSSVKLFKDTLDYFKAIIKFKRNLK